MGKISAATLKEITRAIAAAENAREAVIVFENEHADIIGKYIDLHNAMLAADEAVASLMSSLTMLDAGQKEEFGGGWGVRRDTRRVVDSQIVLRRAREFMDRNLDLVKLSVTDLEKAVTRPRNGQLLPADVFAAAVREEPGAIKPLIPPFKPKARR